MRALIAHRASGEPSVWRRHPYARGVLGNSARSVLFSVLADVVHRYSAGVDSVRTMRRTWDGLAGRIDADRHRAVAERLATQERVARWWRDASLLYFQQFARKPIPPQYERPARPLEFYTAHTSDRIPDF